MEESQTESLSQSQHSYLKNFGLGLRNALSTQRRTDLTLICQETKFPAHRIILESASPYFAEMFQNSFEDIQSRCVELPTISPKTMDFILRFLYIDPSLKASKLTFENFKEIFKSSHFLQIDSLINFSRQHIENALDLKNVFEIWHFVSKYKESFSLDFLINFLSKNRREIIKDGRCLAINDIQMQMLMDTMIKVPIEDQLLKILLEWTKRDMPNRISIFCNTLNCLDSHSLTKSYMQRLIQEPEVRNNSDILFALINVCLITYEEQINKDVIPMDIADTINDKNEETTQKLIFKAKHSDPVTGYYFGKIQDANKHVSHEVYVQIVNLETGKKEKPIKLPFRGNPVFCQRNAAMCVCFGQREYSNYYELLYIKGDIMVTEFVPYSMTRNAAITKDGSLGWLGTNKVSHYNPNTKQCKVKTLDYTQNCRKIVAVGKKLFIVESGKTRESNAVIYEWKRDSLTFLDSFPFFKADRIVVFQNKIYFFICANVIECYAYRPYLKNDVRLYQIALNYEQIEIYAHVFKNCVPYPRNEDIIFYSSNESYWFDPDSGQLTPVSSKTKTDLYNDGNVQVVCF